MTDNAPISVGPPGTITVVDPNLDVPRRDESKQTSRKRKRINKTPSEDDDSNVAHKAKRMMTMQSTVDMCDDDGDDVNNDTPVMYVGEREAHGEEYDEDEDSETHVDNRSPVQRFLDAKHRRRRLGRHMAKDQVEEDLEDVKRFLSLSEADREAYLSIYEYDGSKDNVVQGLAKASSLALRVGLLYTVPPRDYDLASMALDMPEIRDSLETIWDCVDLDYFQATKTMKSLSAVGHIGDTLLGAAMRLYQGVARASELRDRKDQIERRKASGGQSLFDLSSGSNGQQPQPSTTPADGEADNKPTFVTTI